MAIYKIPTEKNNIIDPIFESITATYSIGKDHVNIMVTLKANGNELFNLSMGQMPNAESWGDQEIEDFATDQLEKYRV
jgi:hypothetical protein